MVVHHRHVPLEQYSESTHSSPGRACYADLQYQFIQGLHVLVGAKYLNTMTASDNVACRTVSFSVLMFLICWVCSLPRTFDGLAKLGLVSAIFTFISVLLATIFAGIQDHPAGYTAADGNPIVTVGPVLGTSFVSGMSAFLNISYTFIGQITLPSFIAEMKEPRFVMCNLYLRSHTGLADLFVTGISPRPCGYAQSERSSSSASWAPLSMPSSAINT